MKNTEKIIKTIVRIKISNPHRITVLQKSLTSKISKINKFLKNNHKNSSLYLEHEIKTRKESQIQLKLN